MKVWWVWIVIAFAAGWLCGCASPSELAAKIQCAPFNLDGQACKACFIVESGSPSLSIVCPTVCVR